MARCTTQKTSMWVTNITMSRPLHSSLSDSDFRIPSFKLGDFKVSSKSISRSHEITVSLSVTNTGSSEGRESVQLYISQVNPKLQRPLKELKGFAKTKTLKPSESEELSMKIDEESLSYYDDSIPAWIAEEGEYIVKIGTSSTEIVFEERIVKDKTTTWVGLSPQ